MTVEQLEKANQINKEMKDKKEFLKAFNSPFGNAIRACNYDGHRDESRVLYLENDKNLSDFIRGYISDQIAELEKQLEDI